MSAKFIWCLLLLLTFTSRARDPFFPADEHRCQPVEKAAAAWRLMGIIGREGRYDSWLVLPPGKPLRRLQGEQLPDSTWHVARIESEVITLASSQDCLPPLRLALKGRHDVENISPVAGAD